MLYEKYADAKRHESGNKRVYRVTAGDMIRFVVAYSPTHAVGVYAQEMNLVSAELVQPKYYFGRMSPDEFVASLGKDQRDQLLKLLK